MLKNERERLLSLRQAGSEFQFEGPAYANECPPYEARDYSKTMVPEDFPGTRLKTRLCRASASTSEPRQGWGTQKSISKRKLTAIVTALLRPHDEITWWLIVTNNNYNYIMVAEWLIAGFSCSPRRQGWRSLWFRPPSLSGNGALGLNGLSLHLRRAPSLYTGHNPHTVFGSYYIRHFAGQLVELIGAVRHISWPSLFQTNFWDHPIVASDRA